MSEEAKKNLEAISEKLKDIPQEVAAAAIDHYAARMEGFAEGFAAGKAHAETAKAEQ
jgi:predicted transcriptional regulator